MINICIIEDNIVLLSSVSDFLKELNVFEEVIGYSSMEDFFNSPPVDPQVILLDIILPGMNGLEGAFHIKEKFSEAEIIMLTDYEERDKVSKAFQAGANGYILKSTPFPKIKAAILEVLDGGIPMSPAIAKMVIHHFAALHFPAKRIELQRLTDRELEVSRLLNEGHSYKQLAYHLNISIDTVRQHIKNIYRKLQINSRTELMRDFRSEM